MSKRKEVSSEEIELNEVSQEELEETSDKFDDLVETHPDPAQASSPLAGIGQAQFDELTGKSQQFMVNLDRQLVDKLPYEIRAKVYEEMVETLIEGQLSSYTARSIYGTPTEVAENVLSQHIKIEEDEVLVSPDWQIAVDGGLFLGSIFVFLTGLSMTNNTDPSRGAMGLFTMILNYVIAGLAMLSVAKNLPDMDAPKGKKGYPRYFLTAIGSMLIWYLVISLSAAFLPRIINPILPAGVYMVIGIVTFAGRFLFKKHFNVQGGIF